jgi:dienelactone hydrolase
MVRAMLAGVLAGVVAAAGAATAQPAASPAPSPQADFQSIQARMAAYHAMPDTPGTGPYAAVKAESPAFPDHVVYRPADLAALGAAQLPVVVWGNGGCSDDGAAERLFLEDVASHGYLVVAPGTIKSGPGAPPQPPEPPLPNGQLSAKTNAEQVRAGLDEAAAANAGPGPLHGRLDLSRAAVAGYSCGGLQALQVAGDPRIKAVVIMHSGVFKDRSEPIHSMHVDKSVLKTLHTPVIYILGGVRDIAYPNGTDDVARIDTVPVLLASHDVGHGGTYFQANGGEEAQVAEHWLDWQLKGDRAAGRMFQGADCTLCRAPGWTVRQKGL